MSGSRGRPGEAPERTGQGRGREDVRRPRGVAGSARSAPVGAPAATAARREDGGEHRSVEANRRRALAIAVLVGLVPGVVVGLVLVVVGLPVAAAAGLVVVAGGSSWWAWRTAPARVLRAVGGCLSDEDERPRLHNLVEGLCASMGLPRPAIFVVAHEVPNAMAVGRDPSTACLIVTSALDRSLSLVQLEGVLAHELVHVKRGDTLLAGMAVVGLAPWSIVVGATRGADLVHSIVGPGREFSADQQAAAVVRYPPGIGSALESLAGGPALEARWPPGTGRIAALTRWLWIDPGGGGPPSPAEGNLDDTRVRSEAQLLR
ncbi:MAG: M48 family metalloprotease [Acidimicrobiales bacterium]